ncbi:MAG: hypothetical protein ACI3ZO_09120 [Candidatus Cryptobacteroides sp.]|nr:hypothetical protein [Bacteroidales bacterium]
MKTLTKFAAIALAISAMAACSKDDAPENTGGGDNKVTERPESILKPLADAGYVLTEVSVDDGQRYTFEYDENDQCIKFSNGKLAYTYDSAEGVFKSEDSKLSLNSSGFADVGHGMKNRSYFNTCLAMENNYDKSMRYRWKDDGINNITSLYYAEDRAVMGSYLYSYINPRKSNKYKMWTYATFMPCLPTGGYYFATSFLGFAGLLGIGSEYLPDNMIFTETRTNDKGESSIYSNEYTFSYDISEDGRILKEICESKYGTKYTVTYTYGPSSKKK